MSEDRSEQWEWFEHQWIVPKEDICKKEFGEAILSPVLHSIRNGLHYEWKLGLFPKGTKTEEHPTPDKQPYMKLLLFIWEGGIKSAVEAKYEVKVVGGEQKSGGPQIVNFQNVHKCDHSMGEVPGWLIEDLYPYQELDKVAWGQPNQVEFQVRTAIREQDFDVDHLFPDPPLHNWPKGLAFYEQTVLGDRSHGRDEGDVVLVAGEERIHCHQLMLDESSTVFQAMFRSDNRDAQTREVAIPDVSAHTLKQLLYFLYVDALPEGWKDGVLALLYAAHKYDVKSLEVLCEKEAVAQLSPETAVESLKMAKMMGLRLLEIKATHFNIHKWGNLPVEEREELGKDKDFMVFMGRLHDAYYYL